MAFAKIKGKDDMCVFSPISDVSSIDVGNRTGIGSSMIGSDTKPTSQISRTGLATARPKPLNISADIARISEIGRSTSAPLAINSGDPPRFSTPVTMPFKNSLISKATQTSEIIDFDVSAAPVSKRRIDAQNNIQGDFVREIVGDCLQDFEQKFRDDCYAFYGKMLFQMMESERRLENTIGMERLDFTRRLTEDNERLRAENERLKALQFGKFFGPGL